MPGGPLARLTARPHFQPLLTQPRWQQPRSRPSAYAPELAPRGSPGAHRAARESHMVAPRLNLGPSNPGTAAARGPAGPAASARPRADAASPTAPGAPSHAGATILAPTVGRAATFSSSTATERARRKHRQPQARRHQQKAAADCPAAEQAHPREPQHHHGADRPLWAAPPAQAAGCVGALCRILFFGACASATSSCLG
jgi:hypothetical protein